MAIKENLKRCLRCNSVSVRPRKGVGRTRHYRVLAKLPIPDAFEIPTCRRCGAEYSDASIDRALDQVLAAVYVDSLQTLAKESIRKLTERDAAMKKRSISQRQLELALGLSQGYLSRLLSGHGKPSTPLVLLLGGPMGEEFGWRGFALPDLQDRLGWRAASVGLGLVWGVWHLPLFFIEGTAQADIPLALFLLSVVAMSVVLAWLVNNTAGSVVAALLFHTAVNFWPSVVPVLPTEVSYRAYALVVAMLVMLALLALALTQQRGRADASPRCIAAKP